MQTENATRSFTVRIPAAHYDTVTAIARRDHKSVNALVNERLEALVREEAERDLERWFDQLGADADEVDVEYAFQAQREVVLRDRR